MVRVTSSKVRYLFKVRMCFGSLGALYISKISTQACSIKHFFQKCFNLVNLFFNDFQNPMHAMGIWSGQNMMTQQHTMNCHSTGKLMG